MESRSHNYRIKGQIEKIIWITLFWTLFSFFQFLMGYITLTGFNYDLTNVNTVDYVKSSLFLGVVAGLLGGSLIVFYWENWLRTKSYTWSLLNIFWSFTVLYFLVHIISDLFSPDTQSNNSLVHSQSWTEVWS